MTDEYLTAKIHEALKVTGGDKKDAQKLLITWAVRDLPLLLSLAKPHLKALAAARIDEESRLTKKGESPENIGLTKTEIDAIILGHTAGEKRKPSKVPPPKSSARQASVMHQLVAAFKSKKK